MGESRTHIFSRQIVGNTIAIYGRSLVSVFFVLFSSRWLLNSLGQTDFGLYSVIGSIIIVITFFNNVLASSDCRFFAFAVGRNDNQEIKQWFSTAFLIQLVFAFIIVAIGFVLGEYAIVFVLSIPVDRIIACRWAFRFSLFSTFFCIISTPFISMLTARQYMAEMAFWGVLQSLSGFIIAWSLRFIPVNGLVFYSLLYNICITLLQIAQIIRARILFMECRVGLLQYFKTDKMKCLLSFAFWNVFGNFGSICRDQGSALLLNISFGPRINAAYSVANQVGSQANQLSVAMINAFSPEITASEGRSEHKRMLELSLNANKLSSILISLFSIPILFEINYILTIWLVTPPPLAASFCRLLLLTFLIDRLGTGYILAFNASGLISILQLSTGCILCVTLPISYYLFKKGFPPASILIAYIISITILLFVRVILGKSKLGISIRGWVLIVLIPTSMVIILSSATAFFITQLLHPSLYRLILTTSVTMLVNLIASFFFILNSSQRRGIIKKLRISMHRSK